MFTTSTRLRLAAALGSAALVLSACGVDIEPGDASAQAGDGPPSTQEPPTEDGSDGGDTDTETTDDADTDAGQDPTAGPDGDAAGDASEADAGDGAQAGDTDDTEAGSGDDEPPISVEYSLAGADSPEAQAVGGLLADPVQACAQVFLPSLPQGATVNSGPQTANRSDRLGMTCFTSSQEGSPLLVGELSIKPQARQDTEPRAESASYLSQQGHLEVRIRPYFDEHPANPTSALADIHARVLGAQVSPHVEPPPAAEVSHDPAVKYTQPGRNSSEVVRLYWLTKDPYAGCEALIDGVFGPDAELDTNARSRYQQDSLTLNCTVHDNGLNFVQARAVVHQVANTGVTGEMGHGFVHGIQRGYVAVTVQADDDAFDHDAALNRMAGNLESFAP